MFKKIFSAFVAVLLIIPSVKISVNAESVVVSAKSAILIDATTNEVLFSKNEHERRGIASTTKILTTLIALEYGEPQREFVATQEAVKVEGTSIGLKPGDTISIKALAYAMLLESGNDAANVTAFGISGSITGFSALMNFYAQKIGMQNSNFTNPSGLTAENHYSTAYDMALLTSVAIKNPIFRKIVSTKSAVIDFGVPEVSRTLSNHNRLLNECEGVFGVKTGYTRASGRCLVTACERNGVTLIAVTLNAYDDWNDHKKLYDYGFSLYKNKAVIEAASNVKIPVVCANKPYVYVECSCTKDLYSTSLINAEVFVEPFLYPPVKKGDVVGEVVFKNSSKNIVKVVPLVSMDDAESLYSEVQKSVSFKEKIKKFIERLSI